MKILSTLLVIVFLCLPVHAADHTMLCCDEASYGCPSCRDVAQITSFGVNNCGMPCYAGGCPECPRSQADLQKDCDAALKELDEYRISGNHLPSVEREYLLLKIADIKCNRGT